MAILHLLLLMLPDSDTSQLTAPSWPLLVYESKVPLWCYNHVQKMSLTEAASIIC